MIVVYKLETLDVEHCVTIAAETFREMIDADPERGWVEMDGDYPPNQLTVSKSIGGVFSVALREPFTFTVPPTASVGVELRITGIPNKAVITSELGTVTMVASGILDLTFDMAGQYHLDFQHPKFLSMSVTIEVT